MERAEDRSNDDRRGFGVYCGGWQDNGVGCQKRPTRNHSNKRLREGGGTRTGSRKRGRDKNGVKQEVYGRARD